MKTYPHYSYRDSHTVTHRVAAGVAGALILASVAWALGYRAGQSDTRVNAYLEAQAAAERDYADMLERVNRVWGIREASAYRRGMEGR